MFHLGYQVWIESNYICVVTGNQMLELVHGRWRCPALLRHNDVKVQMLVCTFAHCRHCAHAL